MTAAPDIRSVMAEPAAQRWEPLRTLCEASTDYVSQMTLGRALRATRQEGAPPVPTIRLALLGSHTLDHLVDGIQVAAMKRGLFVDLQVGKYGQYRQDLLEPAEKLRSFSPQFVALSLSLRNMLGAISLNAQHDVVERAIQRKFDELAALWSACRKHFSATPLQATFLDTSPTYFGNIERTVPGAPSRIALRMNSRLYDAAADGAVGLVDVAARAERDGIRQWFDADRWLQAKMEISPQAAPWFGELVVARLVAEKGRGAKCLITDLDNTLWGGVVGDVGLEGLILGEGSAGGEAFLALQQYLLRLKERGVLLAVCSKNEDATARDVFRDHPDMVLRLGDISAFRANWQDKSENIVSIAEELNLGLDAMVFLDDNPAERARVRHALPDVNVPEVNEDPLGMIERLIDGSYFEALDLTEEDAIRSDQYATEAKRSRRQREMPTLAAFLADLDMTMHCGSAGAIELPRVHQLINKTNQFNTTGRRYRRDELITYAARPDHDVSFVRLLDRFGDNGIVSALLTATDRTQSRLQVDLWVMSCRVFGRRLEHAVTNLLVERAAHAGCDAVSIPFEATARNEPTIRALDTLGYTRDGDVWVLDVRDFEVLDCPITKAIPDD